jgi:hypothetical protein
MVGSRKWSVGLPHESCSGGSGRDDGRSGTRCLLEDDVVFHPKAGEMLERLLRELPEDWDQVYLGG